VRRGLTLATGALALALAYPAAAQDFAVVHATLALGDGSEPINGGTVVVRDGKIAAAGADLKVPEGVQVIDGKNLWVTPGVFASLTDIGIMDSDGIAESNDVSASRSAFSAALDISPVVNPQNQQIKISRTKGITRASVAPIAAKSIFAGQGAVIDLGADTDPVVVPRAFQFVELGERGAVLAGGSRTSAFVSLVNQLREARDLASAAGRNDDALSNRPDAEALVPVLEGRQKLYVHVERASDILSALKLRRDFPKLDLVLVGAAEGWMVAGDIAAAKVPVIADALSDLPASFEKLAATESNVGRLVEAGVMVAIRSFIGDQFQYYGPQVAGNLVALSFVPGATGLSWGEAFATIATNPAKIAGVGGKMGVLTPGAAGDVVIWDGDPLEVRSAPLRVFIDGIEQPLDSHQTRLRERYATPGEGDLPKAYEW